MRLTNYLLRIALIGLFLTASSSAQEKAITAQSNNWKVTVVSAVKTTELPLGWDIIPINDANNCLLILGLRITYVGPDGDVAAPSTTLLDEKGRDFKAWGNMETSDSHISNVSWLLSATHKTPDKKKLSTGETINTEPLSYFFEVPKQPGKLRLVFGDVPPVQIEVQELQK